MEKGYNKQIYRGEMMDWLAIVGIACVAVGLLVGSYSLGYCRGVMDMEKEYTSTFDEYEKTIDEYYRATRNLKEENERLKNELS